MKDEEFRRRVREMLLDFYMDVGNAGYFEKEETTSLKEFNEFLNKWIEAHFPFEMNDEKHGHC